MTQETDTAGDEGIWFFGQVSASISHEIKNVLAIINENAGLLKDFARMQEKGVLIDRQRLETLADRIADQIRRVDEIVKHMNRFAHSVDNPLANVNLEEILSLMTALCARRAAKSGVTLAADIQGIAANIVTLPFWLEYLLWRILDVAAFAAREDKTIRLRAEKTPKGVRVIFYPLDISRARTSGALFFQGQEALLESLKAELSGDIGSDELLLDLPLDVSR